MLISIFCISLNFKFLKFEGTIFNHHKETLFFFLHFFQNCFPLTSQEGACLIIDNIFYFVKENHFLFSYRKLKIIFKIFINENNFLELK